MTSAEVLSHYVKKLSHPLKEIRERSLQLLTAKLQLGWELEDELSGTRELLEALLAWFHVQQPSLQKEALLLLYTTIKTKSGTYIAKEFDIRKILSTLSKVKNKIEPDAAGIYNDLMETLRFLNSVVSEDNVAVPPLFLHSLGGSESDGGSSVGHFIRGPYQTTSVETSLSNDDSDVKQNKANPTGDGVRVLLFPWVDICSSDSKTILLVEDALKLLKSTRRCCRFIRDVFLRDFPAEIFLNRPAIVKHLVSISDGGSSSHTDEALHVLLCITQSLRARLRHLTSLHTIHNHTKKTDENRNTIDHDQIDQLNAELEQMAGYELSNSPHQEDSLAALSQLPAPIYALDTLHSVLTIMARNIVLVQPGDKNYVLNLRKFNTCLALIESLIQLLLDCVNKMFWRNDHSNKTHRDIAHKSCMAMRLIGDLLMKYRKSFDEDTTRWHHRVAHLRLTSCSERLMKWSQLSALPPSSLAMALQSAQVDPALQLFYPDLSERIAQALQNTKTAVDQEYKTKYKELKKLYVSMEQAAQFMKSKNCKYTKNVLICIKNSLPALEMHQNEVYLDQVADILLSKIREFEMEDTDWSVARSISLSLMAHNIEWVKTRFYSKIAEMVRTVLVSDEAQQTDNEKNLALIFDVGILTEICCHGLSSASKGIESSACNIMTYLLRGRLVVSERCWWKLLASLLPVLPLLHVYAAHDTHLGQAICKSLETDIATCMGVSLSEVTMGLARLLFVRCAPVQHQAATQICGILDDERYLPPKEALRADVLISALRRIQPQDFNVDLSCSPSTSPQSTGLMQIVDVLRQDLSTEDGTQSARSRSPTLEPSLRRSTLQQLAVLMQRQDLHDTFMQCDGLDIVTTTLRMSMIVDDYLAYPECAISCVSVLNSVCFLSRHCLAKVPDILPLLFRVILVFPANDSAVLMAAQVIALIAWSGFSLQELDANRRRVPALPLCVTDRTSLPFAANSYWNTSTNAQHSSLEWLLSDEQFNAAIRVHWWCAHEGGSRVLLGAALPPAPLALRPTPRDLATLRAASPVYASTKLLMDLENATSHRQVNDALNMLESYTYVLPLSSVRMREFAALPWQHTRRFLCAPPASSRDTSLLLAILHFLTAYLNNVPEGGEAVSWIKSSFIGDDATIISLLNRTELYPQQTQQEHIEVTQLHIHIVKVLLRCIILIEDTCDGEIESLVKILLACLEKVDLKNFHMLGYLNELTRTIRYAVNSSSCKLSEETLIHGMNVSTATLSGCASGGGRKGQACRLDCLLALLALIRQVHDQAIPVQRWCEAWNSDVMCAIVSCSGGAYACCELRAAALRVMAATARHTQLTQLQQAVPDESLSNYATGILCDSHEANVVRAAAASLLASTTARQSPHTDMYETEVMNQLEENNFLETALEIFVGFCKENEHMDCLEPNVPLSLLERRSELEVRTKKGTDIIIVPSLQHCHGRPPPTAELVAAAADVIYNVSLYSSCPVHKWNEKGLYRILFRCVTFPPPGSSVTSRMRASACRALAAAVRNKSTRVTLANTKDCLYNLLLHITPYEDDSTMDDISAQAQTFQLVACLLSERAASDTVWRSLSDQQMAPFFIATLQAIQSRHDKVQECALYCLSQLCQSAQKKSVDQHKDLSRVDFLDNLPSPFCDERQGGGDSATECQPEYYVEEIVNVLIHMYKKQSIESKMPYEGERWNRICSSLCCVLSMSRRCRLHGVHRQLPRVLLATLQAVRDRLTLHGPADVIKSAHTNPMLRTLHWLLTCISCHMVECPQAKEAFADDNLALSLNRLWSWCMLTDQLRAALIHLMVTFCNECPQAWSAMATCVGGRSLVGELCTLCGREAALVSHSHTDTSLLACLRTLRLLTPHHHCRAIILKSDVLLNMYKLRVRERSGSNAGVEWARLCEAIARHADAAGAILSLRPLLTAPAVRARLMPAIAHAARHRRAAVLHAPELLELISGTLLASGDTAEVVSAARAVWALAANNHKAKLLLRSSGVASSVQAALQRMQRLQSDVTQPAIQILMYTNNVLQSS